LGQSGKKNIPPLKSPKPKSFTPVAATCIIQMLFRFSKEKKKLINKENTKLFYVKLLKCWFSKAAEMVTHKFQGTQNSVLKLSSFRNYTLAKCVISTI
jgi:hypothetical protein